MISVLGPADSKLIVTLLVTRYIVTIITLLVIRVCLPRVMHSRIITTHAIRLPILLDVLQPGI